MTEFLILTLSPYISDMYAVVVKSGNWPFIKLIVRGRCFCGCGCGLECRSTKDAVLFIVRLLSLCLITSALRLIMGAPIFGLWILSKDSERPSITDSPPIDSLSFSSGTMVITCSSSCN